MRAEAISMPKFRVIFVIKSWHKLGFTGISFAGVWAGVSATRLLHFYSQNQSLEVGDESGNKMLGMGTRGLPWHSHGSWAW